MKGRGEGRSDAKADKKTTPPSTIPVLLLSMMLHVVSLWLSSVSCSSCVLSPSLAHPQPTHGSGGRVRKREGSGAVQALVSNSQNTGASSAVVATTPKHATVQAAIKKVNSIPARPRTEVLICVHVHSICLSCSSPPSKAEGSLALMTGLQQLVVQKLIGYPGGDYK